MNIHKEIVKIIGKTKGVSIPGKKGLHLYTDLGFHSLSFVALLLKIEETFSISFSIMEMESCLLMDQLVGLVEKKIGEQNGHDWTLADEPGKR